MKKEIFQTLSRKVKKRNNNNRRLSVQTSLVNNLNYNLFFYMLKKESIFINRKALSEIFFNELGVASSLRKWLLHFYKI